MRRTLIATTLAFTGFLSVFATAATAHAQEPEPAAAPVYEDEPEPSSGFMLGATLSYVAPWGFLEAVPGAGPAIGVSGGYRSKFVYGGFSYNHAFLSTGPAWGEKTVTWTITSASSDYVGVDFLTFSAPDAPVSLFTRLSFGARVLELSETSTIGDSSPTTSGWDFTPIALGIQVHPSNSLRIVAEASLEVSSQFAFGNLGLTTYVDLGGGPAAPTVARAREASR